jgi:hypothetical protein
MAFNEQDAASIERLKDARRILPGLQELTAGQVKQKSGYHC